MEKNAAARPRAILAAGAGIQLLTGLPAAWGVFQQPVREAYALGEMGATAAFSVLIAAFDFLVIILDRIILRVLVFALVLRAGFGLRNPRYICKISKRKAR